MSNLKLNLKGIEIETRRYICWDSSGICSSNNDYPESIEFAEDFAWTSGRLAFRRHDELDDVLPVELRRETVIDTENEDDMKFLRALVEL